MTRSSRYCAPFRRRKEGKTDYKARRALLVSRKPRLVTRTSLKNVVAQIIVAKPKGDEVLVSANSRELIRKYGWKAPGGNIPAAYLTGLLCGLKAKVNGVPEAIFDIGLFPPSKGAKVFAVLKGVLDAELEVPHSEEKLPDNNRIMGEHIVKYAETLATDVEQYRKRFSKYLKQELRPETLPEHVTQVKAEVTAALKSGGKKK